MKNGKALIKNNITFLTVIKIRIVFNSYLSKLAVKYSKKAINY